MEAIFPSQKCTLKATPILETNSRRAKNKLVHFLMFIPQKYSKKVKPQSFISLKIDADSKIQVKTATEKQAG